jgi:ABC-type branched-subunit amino acid transport system ATPase component
MEPDQIDPGAEEREIVREIAGRILTTLEGVSGSESLDSVVTGSCWYVVLDQRNRQIVLDLRALYLGFIVTGLRSDKPPGESGAEWFQEWLRPLVGGQAMSGAVYARADLFQARRLLDAGFTPVLSRSVTELQSVASAFAQKTMKQWTYDARHLFAAMIDRGAITELTERLFKLSLTEADVLDLKRTFVERIMRSPQLGETREAWLEAFSLERSTPEVADVSPTSSGKGSTGLDVVSPFNGDTPQSGGKDVLDTQQDVQVLAELICLDRVTPLAVAIFGDWGSGKSTFMDQLEKAVDSMPGRMAGQALPLVEETNAARFVHPIVQIRFNAWHFADANLWASLTAEFFDQLRAGGEDDAVKRRHAELVQRVNQHVHALSDTLSANRQAMARNGKAVLDAQEARDMAAEGVLQASGKALRQATMDQLSQALADHKGLMASLGLTRKSPGAVSDAGDAAKPRAGNEEATTPAPPEPAESAEIVVAVVKDLASTFGKLKAMGRVLFKTPWRAVVAGSLLMAIVACVALVLFDPRKVLDGPGTWAALLASLVALGGLGRTIGPVIKLVNGLAERGASIAAEVATADQAAVGLLLTQEAKLRGALAEAQALEDAELASAKALARYVDPNGRANPPRLLRYVLEDDPETKALEKDIGLIGRTRRLFQAVDTIAKKVRDERGKEGYADLADADWETPERIVIYIDDLDRCSETKVYEVLQAVHLLLAFELFVVVVGVDVKWVQAALARQFETGDAKVDAANEQQRNERAMHYLEKIFQIPFWLRPLSSGEGGTFLPYIEDLAGDSVETTQANQEAAERARKSAASASEAKRAQKGTVGAREVASDAPEGARSSGEDAAAEAISSTGRQDAERAVKLVEARRKLQLTNAEIAFLGAPEIAALAATAPRGVKRLVNIYRIARARRGHKNPDAVLGGGPGRPPEYPLIALMAAIETGQRPVVADWLHDLLQSGPSGSVESLIAPYRTNPPEHLKIAEVNALYAGCAAATQQRKVGFSAADLLDAARLVRRYSFNRYR